MSTYPDDLGYFDAVQVYFTELTGRAMFFSGRDLELLKNWRAQGASAAAICEGVREAVEAMPDDDPPRDLHACRHYIEPRVERARERSAGRPGAAETCDGRDTDASSSDDATNHSDTIDDTSETTETTGSSREHEMPHLFERALANVERAGRQCESEERRAIYRRAWRYVQKLGRRSNTSTREPYEQLMELEREIIEQYLETMEDDERRRLNRHVREESDGFLETMTDEAREEHLAARRRRYLVEHDDFVPLLD